MNTKTRVLVMVLAALARDADSLDGEEPVSRTARDVRANASKPINPLWNSTWTDKLKQDLLLNYDKFARPMQHTNKTTVTISPTLRHIELDETRSIMTIHCWANMYWEDEKLKWDPNNYNGLKELHLADHEVWQPDVFPYNSATGSTFDHYGNTNLIAFGNGSVLWVPPSVFHVFCQLDFTEWPFDTQTCSMKIGSWTYNGEQVDLLSGQHMQTIHEMPDLIPNSEWEFVKMSVERHEVLYACCPVPYVDITFDITVRRNSAVYKALIITPATSIVLITLASFWLPATSGDKVTLAGAATLINILFILYFTQKMPVMAGQTPYVVAFYSRALYFVSFSIVIAVTVVNIAKNPKVSPLPWSLKRNLNGWLAKCLLIPTMQQQSSSKAEEMTDNQPVLSEQGRHLSETNSKMHQKDWIMLATAVDRFFFILYCIAFALLALVYSV